LIFDSRFSRKVDLPVPILPSIEMMKGLETKADMLY